MKLKTLLKLIQTLAVEPFREYNINQLSSLSGISLATTYRTLKQMESLGMLLKRENGVEKLYKLNLQNSFTRKFSEAISILKKREFFKQNPKYLSLLKLKKLEGLIDLMLLHFKNEKIQIFLLSERSFQKDLKLGDLDISLLFLTKEGLKNELKNSSDLIVLHGESKFWALIASLYENKK